MAKVAATGSNLSLVLCLFVVLSCLGSKLPFKLVSLCYSFTEGQTGPGSQRQEVKGQANNETFVFCNNNTCRAIGVLGRKVNVTETWQVQVDALQQGCGLFNALMLHMMRENTMGGTVHLLLTARVCCWHEADGQFNASWNFDINERKMLHFNSITGTWTTLHPASIMLLEKRKKNTEITTFLQMTSQNHCKTWFQEFKSHWGQEVKHTDSSKAMIIIPHISVLLILLTCSLLLLLSGGSSAMTG
uniref:UL16-binding protein 1-like isoform X1 n=1 Tax=Myodes glareolus TaxID=447135 RepID=UPI00201FB903|nr:UL16-binding protein 1-like isoform X1 [Myodes glareolus]XP_048281345.1 UL16-binding protein 1-like isoform X2 [Myodes glareolus]